MTGDEEQKANKPSQGALARFEAGGELSAIEDRNKRERRLRGLPPDRKELAQESMRMADLCHYFSQQKMDVPPQILEQVGGLSRVQIEDRIRKLKDINRGLMEYLNDVGQDPGIRQ